MAVDTSVIGKRTGANRVRIERGPVGFFASAVLDDNPVYRDVEAASGAGFDAIPAPPTFSFAMRHMGVIGEEQPPDPTGGTNPMHAVMGDLHAKGALILHGEEEFEYHRPVMVGDVLLGEGTIVDLYEKDTDSAVMTFIVIETVWRDEANGDPVVTERFNLIGRLKK
ncbi:MAG TPA: MaoC family dehydratase N-terminal domain-containing protein [Acidimicrobiia bacterium]|jgi:acyl dehydratase